MNIFERFVSMCDTSQERSTSSQHIQFRKTRLGRDFIRMSILNFRAKIIFEQVFQHFNKLKISIYGFSDFDRA